MKHRGRLNRQAQRRVLFAQGKISPTLVNRGLWNGLVLPTICVAALFALDLAPVRAQNATWTGPGGDWNTATNWSSGSVPNGVATFAGAPPTAITFSAPGVTAVQNLAFAAPGYTFAVTPFPGSFRQLQITGSGGAGGIVTSLPANFPTFNLTDELHFINSSTAGPAIINVSDTANVNFNLEDRTSPTSIAKAGTAIITAGVAGSADDGTGGFVQFYGNSTADHATITAFVGSNIEFHDASSAGNATLIVGNPTIPVGAGDNGFLFFNDTTTAGNANITVNPGGELDFSPPFGPPCCTGGTATAGDATITSRGVIGFYEGSTAGNATITNSTGSVDFFDSSSAGAASIHVDGLGNVNFHDGSTAGTATMTAGDAGSNDDFTGGFIKFFDNSTADHATITAYVGSNIEFHDASNAGNATLIVGNSTIPAGAGDNGFLFFDDTATAGHANITVNPGGEMDFSPIFPGCGCSGGTTTAGDATITNNGITGFYQGSSAGTAAFIANAGGIVDISGLGTFPDTGAPTDPSVTGTTAGSIAGAGSYFLGSKQLTVGSNNLSTIVSGTISDGGAAGGVGGSLVKVGTGTLTIDGAGTYTGGTTVSEGALVVGDFANPTAALSGGGPIAVGSSGTLGGYGSVTGSVVNNGVIAAGNAAPGLASSPTGTFTVIGNLLNAGTIQLASGDSIGNVLEFAAAMLAPAARWPSTHSLEATARLPTDW
jgi:autotransporter-associated beta strand protein